MKPLFWFESTFATLLPGSVAVARLTLNQLAKVRILLGQLERSQMWVIKNTSTDLYYTGINGYNRVCFGKLNSSEIILFRRKEFADFTIKNIVNQDLIVVEVELKEKQ